MLASLSYSKKVELAQLLEEQARRKNRNRLSRYQPYSKQASFHGAGATNRERLFMAGNQLGKTLAGGAEWAMHLTGRYPDWWQGKVFPKPVAMWAAGLTGESTRDTVQKMLVGQPERRDAWGTGMIPGDAFAETYLARGIPNALDSIVVKHGGGGDLQSGRSILGFKSYEKGREKWQGPTLDGVWFDEEPPPDIYSEGLTRTNATGGITMITFTPLLGMSEVVLMFLTADQVNSMVKAKVS
ncbi:terminase family protein [Mesorhizobium sp. M0915]|uniref:terminase large subunit domain-containing protein n=1 Tax=Mesorhizobium sp. M0915 TaxID=2957027 RepID=UPI00333C5FCB